MTRMLVLATAVLLVGAPTLRAIELPSEDDPDFSFDVEPPPLIQNRGDESSATAAPEPADVDPAHLEKQLDRAKKRAANAERLRKIGALSKVEVEQRALRVVRLESDLAKVRLDLAREELASQQTRSAAGEISKEDLAQIEASLARAVEAAQTATANLQRAELEAAEANLHRQQKLLVMGSARKSDVSRAEEKIAELKAPKN